MFWKPNLNLTLSGESREDRARPGAHEPGDPRRHGGRDEVVAKDLHDQRLQPPEDGQPAWRLGKHDLGY